MSSESRSELECFRQLHQSPEIFELIQSHKGTEFQLQKQLREQYPEDVVRAALTLAELRVRGRAKFSRADQMWFDRKSLEQATPEAVSQYKAARFSGTVYDFCCGMGGDLVALAQHATVTGVDLEPVLCQFARWNSEVYEVADRVTLINQSLEEVKDREGLLHIDPDRRPGSGGKVIRIEDYRPDLETLLELIQEFEGGAIKLSPASNFAGKFPGTETELISLNGECKEATIWFGRLAGESEFRATSISKTGEVASIAGHPMDAYTSVTPPGEYLYDPDPAVVRSGLLDVAAAESGLSRLDTEEEYLTSTDPVESPFFRRFRILEELPNQDRDLKKYFRSADFGQLEIKCRRIPVPIEALRRKLSLKGKDAGVLVIARLEGKSRALICERE
ncbi:RNA cap guanine-N2 methyltransferase [Gimesia panareensis]|uniref:RNA cap guanine-N2 methyltransferase n=1 Tax=Gimesia panareensis TaxID=2527978 RepID=A0A518FL64_9PLAN|nr:class I SAM-dependent methyltransferase [Gimesia panareensis]QDV17083.1 RNA cap guanine-N2 methyltransferase [Gimesia panareensis]